MLARKINIILCPVIALVILVFSLIPETPKELIHLSDKTNHIIAYFLLSLSFFFALKSKAINMVFLSIIAILACTLYGGIIEFIQSFTGRTPEMLDILADFTGSASGTLIALSILFIKKKMQP